MYKYIRYIPLVVTFILLNLNCAEPVEEYVEPPLGMVYVPGGDTWIGSEDGLPMERPVFKAKISSFFIDIHPVTVAQFMLP